MFHRRRSDSIPKIRLPEIPDPFNVEDLFLNVSRQRGRPIHLLPRPLPPGSPCGLWISTGTADYMLYEQATTPAHQDHIKLHELGHLLHDHGIGQRLSSEVARTLLPTLNPTAINRMLGRGQYTGEEEVEAETFASLVLTQVSLRSREPERPVPPGSADVVLRLENTLRSPEQRKAK
ncbi:ParH-like protein [Streptomyces gibsoniae]|uniref:ParH-like protein n=1 Tax=Streptomyces gibsoniae TaxID=3075529 RepID=A0ABU2TV03_9ACTN|nr:ParH-like protein [Streptomyces sp. DSM 41699]MDT0464792.1 ParH-like protein [Streptomyces sp. DSM 41699]